MADKKYNIDDILRIFAKLEKKIEGLSCLVKECCAKIPVNVGTGIGLFKKFNQNKWEFKSLIAGDNVVITEQSNTITINSTAEPFTCQDVDTCLGISELGSPTKFLNEQGDFITIEGGGFTCADLNSCSTTNLPEGSNLYFTNTRAINALAGTPTYVNYYHPATGLITGDQYFTRLNTGRTRIWGDITGQDGGFLDLNPIGTSYFGAYNSGSLDNYFWVNGANLGWSWNSFEFTLPTSDGSSGWVLTTNGSGILTFQPQSGGGLITAIADTNTIDLTETAGTLTADVNYQNTATINLSENASGLKADFASMNISQFTNDSGYTTNTGTVTSVSALTLGTTGTDLSSTVANGTTTPVITLNVPTASATNRGALSSTDWTTFNSKISGSGTTNEIAYFSGSSTLSSLTTATYPSLTELSYVKGVTSAIQTQISAKQDKSVIAKSTVISTHTGNTSETKVASVMIPGGTYAAGNIIRIFQRMLKTGGANGWTPRIRIGTADNLSGTVIFTNNLTAGVLNDACIKTGVIRNISTDTQFGSTGAHDDDTISSSGAAFVSYSINWANDVWIVFSVQNLSTSDTSGNYYHEITKS